MGAEPGRVAAQHGEAVSAAWHASTGGPGGSGWAERGGGEVP